MRKAECRLVFTYEKQLKKPSMSCVGKEGLDQPVESNQGLRCPLTELLNTVRSIQRRRLCWSEWAPVWFAYMAFFLCCPLYTFFASAIPHLTFKTLWANTADDQIMIFLNFPRK